MAFGIKTVGGGNVSFDVVPTSSNTVVTIDNVSGIPVYGDSITGALILPSGTTAQRTSSPTVGAIRQNLTLGIIEIWNGYNWGDITGKLPSTYRTQRSLRFRASASAYLSRTPATTTNRRTNTWSFWFKRGDLGRLQWVFSNRLSTSSSQFLTDIYFNASNTLGFELYDGASNSVGKLETTQVFREPSAWYHIVVQLDTTQATASNRMKLFLNGSQITVFNIATYPAQNFDTGVNVSTYPSWIGNFVTSPPSSAYNSDGYLAEVNFIDGQALDPSYFGEIDVISGSWIPKTYTGTYGANGFYLDFTTNTSTTTLGYNKAIVDYEASAFTDVFSTVTKTNNNDGTWRWVFGNATTVMRLGSLSTISGTVTLTARIKLVSGTVSSFPVDYGDGTQIDIKNDLIAGQWVTITKTLTAGAWGFLDFPSNVNLNGVTLDVDYVSLSGQNNWTTNNISLTAGVTYDSMLDVPTLTSATAANFAVLNPLAQTSGASITNGNLTLTGGNVGTVSTIIPTSGKWYWEVTLLDAYTPSSSYFGDFGVTNGTVANYDASIYGAGVRAYTGTGAGGGGTYINNVQITASTTWAINDIVGLAFDVTNLTLDVYRNNVKIGTTLSVPAGYIYPTFYQNGTADTGSSAANFGQRPFTYTPPTGYVALNAYNLP